MIRALASLFLFVLACADPASAEPVTLRVGPWQLRGDLALAPGAGRAPAALLLNKAAGDRRAYEGLARELTRRGVSSLRLDLRAHGESINAGKFVPGTPDAADILDGTADDVAAAIAFLQKNRRIDPGRLAVVGSSYSAEAMAEEAVDRVQSLSTRGEVRVLDAGTHATDVLAEVPEIEARIADWIAAALR